MVTSNGVIGGARVALLLRWCGTFGGSLAMSAGPWGCVGSPRGPGEAGCRTLCDLEAEGLFLLVRAVLAELSLEAPGQEDHAVGI